MESESTTQKMPTSHGLCIIVDQVNVEHFDDTSPEKYKHNILKKEKETCIARIRTLFTDLDYRVKSVSGQNIETDIQQILDHSKGSCFEWLVVFIVGSREPLQQDGTNPLDSRYRKLWKLVSDEFLAKNPKLLIEHIMTDEQKESANILDAKAEETFVISNYVHVCSLMEICRTFDKTDTMALAFINIFDDVFREYGHKSNVIHLLTLVRQRIEIVMYKKQSGNPDERDLFLGSHFMTFTCFMDNDAPIFIARAYVDDTKQNSYPKETKLSRHELKKTVSFKYAQESFQAINAARPTHYEMDKIPRGYCVIINISSDRLGSMIDQVKMDQLFTELLYETKIIANKSHKAIEEDLYSIRTSISEAHQALAVIIMAHGDTDEQGYHTFVDVFGKSKGSSYIFDVFDGVTCPNLLAKPKVYIVQTCFGLKAMSGVLGELSSIPKKMTQHETKFFKNDNNKDPVSKEEGAVNVPYRMSDVIIVHANVTGFVSRRHMIKGAFLIDAVDEEFRKSVGEKSLNDILTEVKNNVISREHGNLQQPVVLNMLNKTLCFYPGYIKDSGSDHYRTDTITKQLGGTTVWLTYDRKACIVTDTVSSELRRFELKNDKTETYKSTNTQLQGVIKQGIALSKAQYLVLVEKQSRRQKRKSCCVLNIDRQNKIWKKERVFTFVKLVTICDVYNDGIGVLTSEGAEGGLLCVYSRDSISPGKSGIRLQVHLPYKSSSSGDLISVVGVTILVLASKSKIIFEFDINGNQIKTINYQHHSVSKAAQPGAFIRPCSVFKGENDAIVVVDYKSLQIFDNNAWSVQRVFKGVRQMCCYSQYTVLAYEEQIDTSSAPCVPLVPYGVKPARQVIELPEQHHRLWSTATSDVVAVGSAQSASISMVTKNGELLHTENLGLKGRINSGIYLTGENHAVIVYDESVYSMRFLIIDQANTRITLTTHTCEVDNPVCLFSVNSDLFGVLCCSTKTKPSVIHVIDRVNHNIKKSIVLGHIAIDSIDTACMDKHGNFYVSNNEEFAVRMYNSDGTLLETLGSEAEEEDVEYGIADIPGELQPPHTLLIDEENSLLIHCEDASIHKYINDSATWSVLPRFLPESRHILYHGRHVYSVYEDKVCVHTIMDQEERQNDNADVAVTVCPVIPQAPTLISTTKLPRRYSKVWTDGEVLILGGEGHPTITILNAEGKKLFSHSVCDSYEADHVVSGIHVTDNLHCVIVVKIIDGMSSLKLWLFNINLHEKRAHLFQRLEVKQPVRAVSVDSNRFAVLGFSDPGRPSRITLISKDDLSELSHLNVCYGPTDIRDHITQSAAGDWFISSHARKTVHRLTGDGVNLGPVAKPAKDDSNPLPEHISQPMQIHHDANKALIVICNAGTIHRKPRDRDWELVADVSVMPDCGIRDICFMHDHMFTVFGNKLRKFLLDRENSS